MRKQKIGGIYLFGAKWYADEASKTVGAAIVGPRMFELVQNRHSARGKLTAEGQAKFEEAARRVSRYLRDQAVQGLSYTWDIHCGCAMCPCSPGYKIQLVYDETKHSVPFYLRSRSLKGKAEINVYVDENGKVELREPTHEVVRDWVERMRRVTV